MRHPEAKRRDQVVQPTRVMVEKGDETRSLRSRPFHHSAILLRPLHANHYQSDSAGTEHLKQTAVSANQRETPGFGIHPDGKVRLADPGRGSRSHRAYYR